MNSTIFAVGTASTSPPPDDSKQTGCGTSITIAMNIAIYCHSYLILCSLFILPLFDIKYYMLLILLLVLLILVKFPYTPHLPKSQQADTRRRYFRRVHMGQAKLGQAVRPGLFPPELTPFVKILVIFFSHHKKKSSRHKINLQAQNLY